MVERNLLAFTMAFIAPFLGLLTMSRDELKTLLRIAAEELTLSAQDKAPVPAHEPESHLIALFDNPLHVCAWLAQMKAGLWVRNGLGLRNQMGLTVEYHNETWPIVAISSCCRRPSAFGTQEEFWLQ